MKAPAQTCMLCDSAADSAVLEAEALASQQIRAAASLERLGPPVGPCSQLRGVRGQARQGAPGRDDLDSARGAALALLGIPAALCLG